MSHCLRRGLQQCTRTLDVGRRLSDKRTQPKDPLVDLHAVHKEWKSSGFHPRAPAYVVKHGAKCLQVQMAHARLTDHVFGAKDYRMFPLPAQYGDKQVDFGTLLTPTTAANPPQVDWDHVPADPQKKYSLILYSPDCSNCNLHWWQTNISPGDDVTNDVTQLQDYIPPVPLKGTGFYRYVLVLLRQDSDLLGVVPVDRFSKLPELIAEHSLSPVGIAFFQAAWDESVGGILAEKLGADEKQFIAERPKLSSEFYAEELFLRKEWEMKTDFM